MNHNFGGDLCGEFRFVQLLQTATGLVAHVSSEPK